MKWIEITIETNREACDAISDMLITIGAGGVAVEDPNDIFGEIAGTQYSGSIYEYVDENILNKFNGIFNAGEIVTIKSYFPESSNSVELMQLIKEKLSDISQYLNTGDLKLRCSEVKDEDWANNWKKYYNTFNITKKVVIKPTWEEYEEQDGVIVIEMDPGMAFGTGTHETTKMCAQMLENYINAGDTVIDVGSGSGILSIIAAKHDARNVIALDIDKEAVRVTIENCSRNNVLDRVAAFQGTLSDVNAFDTPGFKEKINEISEGRKADLIVANIIASVIIDLSDKIDKFLKPGGLIVASGIIKEKKDMVLDSYEPRGFKCIDLMEDGEWVAIVFKCPDSL
ncbi:MAG TPA: 50S ribosomal protein L11 methyltransferase [Clostridiales bacterium]|nr:50S ribosomal protein L11 methyltransferase [Clostridiales bacterium]